MSPYINLLDHLISDILLYSQNWMISEEMVFNALSNGSQPAHLEALWRGDIIPALFCNRCNGTILFAIMLGVVSVILLN